ncbi:SusD/RagB family nutrient-binding outer membrane lipoprotein [Mangrovibacterium diazotrophicum]|nr:SusD/RagB family nutrient-binding outer membrane lipoprotein [Mangrovibacterium diazotrophicum]
MKLIRITYYLMFVMSVLVFQSCQDLTELNENPNGVEPSTVDPNLLISTVLTEYGQSVVDNGFGNVAGVMQHLEKDSWSSAFNNYDWEEEEWSGYYSMLRTNKLAYERAVEEGMEFHQGVCLVMRAMIFGRITDFWGDAPYTYALNAEDGGTDDILPPFDSQETIYKGIIDELATAASLLSKESTEYSNVSAEADVFYGGDATKWMKLANSLALRFYMRLSAKLPDYAEAGVKKMLAESLISSVDEGCMMSYIGSSDDDSWPSNTEYDSSSSNFKRYKPCTTLLYRLNELNDPRLGTWFNPVEIPIVVSSLYAPTEDTVVDDVRYITPEYLAANSMMIFDESTFKQAVEDGYTLVDTNSVYVGLPPSVSSYEPYDYNLNPNPTQGGGNVHVSYLSDLFKDAENEYLLARIFPYSEVCFLKAEAAYYGWGGVAEDSYDAGVEASLEEWGVDDDFSSYIANDGVAFDGTLDQIMEQKWIASFTNASEAWFDWRRTGLPDLQTGPSPLRDAIPLRFYYGSDEKENNATNYLAAIENLETTSYSSSDDNDSAWSKMWLLQGTDEPW